MTLVENVLQTAGANIISNAKDLFQQGLKNFVHDTNLDTNGMERKAIEAAYEAFKKLHLEDLIKGEYVGGQAGKLSGLKIPNIKINGTEIDTQDLINDPEAVLRKAATTLAEKEIDKAIQGKVGETLKKYGVGQILTDEVKELIRATILGAKYSISRNPSIKETVEKVAKEGIVNYYNSIVEMMESPDWQNKQLKPLKDLVDKGVTGFNDVTGKVTGEIGKIGEKLNGEIDKITGKLDEISKMDIANEISKLIEKNLDVGGIFGKFDEQLKKFGLDKIGLGSTSEIINKHLGKLIDSTGIQKELSKIKEISDKVREAKEYIKKYETLVMNEIKAFEEKARQYILELEAEFAKQLLNFVNIVLIGDLAKFFSQMFGIDLSEGVGSLLGSIGGGLLGNISGDLLGGLGSELIGGVGGDLIGSAIDGISGSIGGSIGDAIGSIGGGIF